MILDQDALDAALDLIGRTGARSFEIGYLRDDVPLEQAGWYAHAQYRGARITAEDHPGPVEAAEALARRLLTGARCVNCDKVITLSGEASRKTCRWTRLGTRWEKGCQQPGKGDHAGQLGKR